MNSTPSLTLSSPWFGRLSDWFVPIVTCLSLCAIVGFTTWEAYQQAVHDSEVLTSHWWRVQIMNGAAALATLVAVIWFNLLNVRRQHDIALANRRFSALIENSEDVMLILDDAGLVRWISPSAKAMTGHDEQGVVGTAFARLIRRDDLLTMELTLERLKATPQLRLTFYGHIHTRSRGWIPIEGTATSHFDTPGITGAIAIFRDVSEREARTQALLQSEQKLNQAQSIAALGSWHYDLSTDRIDLSAEAQRIFGIGPQRDFSRRTLLASVHPDDRRTVADMWRATVEGDDFDLGHRIVVEGETRWVHARAHCYFDDRAQLTFAIGTIQDVTAQHQAATQLAELLAFNQSIIDASPVGIAVLDAQGHVVIANGTLERLINIAPGRLEKINIHELALWRDTPIGRSAEATLNTGVAGVARHTTQDSNGADVTVEYQFSRIIRQGQPHLLLVLSDISDFERASLVMRTAQRLAEEANRAKSEFLANMSHEIRTPLNAVIGLAQLALDRTADATLREYLSQMGQSANALLDILNDILDYSKIEAGRLTVDRHEFGIRDITARIIGIFRQQAGAKGLALTTHIADDVPPRVFGDSTRISQIIVNLVANAVKFTELGTVQLTINRRLTSADLAKTDSANADAITDDAPIWIDFIISDTGIGMTVAAIAQLFRPFHQADGSTTRRYGGTGLGLTISRRLAELMKGEITVTSTVGQGSRFVLSLPLTPSGVRMATPTSTPPSPDIDPNSLAYRARTIAGARILIVEDEPINQMVLQRLLVRARLDVSIARHGQDALDQLAALSEHNTPPFDAILMDLQMPVMDGFAATRAIRAQARWAHLPIIAVTASVLVHDELACRDAGMSGFIAKPVQPSTLIDLLVEQITPHRPTLPVSTDPAEITPAAPHPLTPVEATSPHSGHSRHTRLSLLYQRLLDNEFISVVEFNDVRALLATLADPRAEQLQAAISRYDYTRAQVLLAELLADLDKSPTASPER
jgi:PAS domain S-box-containing protein